MASTKPQKKDAELLDSEHPDGRTDAKPYDTKGSERDTEHRKVGKDPKA